MVNNVIMMLELASHPGSIKEVESFVAELARKLELERQKHGDILTSLTEAVNNAIRHGNCNDARKKVKIKLRQSERELTFRVSDEGCGFDYHSLPDPTKPENLCKLGGRGVFLMCQLTDRIAFVNGGRTVEMRFRL
jgi:serine/threonine-protein kinase RsbW